MLLEVAYFPPDTVAGVARRYGLVTDASQRFERGVDPTRPGARDRARDGAAGRDRGRPCRPRRPDAGRGGAAQAARRDAAAGTGREPPGRADSAAPRSRTSCDASACRWPARGDILGVIPPSHRFDIAIEQDLIEEVGRIHGYDNIPRSDAKMAQRPQPATERAVTRERLRLLLVDRGYQEVITYSFVDPRLQRLMFPRQQALRACEPAVDRARRNARFAVAGTGRDAPLQPAQAAGTRAHLRGRYALRDGQAAALIESQAIAGLVTGAALPEQWGAENRAADFFDLKSDVEGLFGLTGRQAAISYIAEPHDGLHPGRSAAIYDGKTRVGWIGQLQPDLSRKLELRAAPWVFELGIDPSFRSEVPVFREISKFPAIRRDLAVLVDEAVTLDVLRESVNLAAKGLLRELAVFDVYRGKGVEPGRKSIALGLILQETSRTLTDEEADAVVAAVVERVKGDLKAGIRE